ncbi:MAG: 2'-deoxycytidine 5'-triphosphate deaminase [Actinomycetia bacterium]|nr:2'-deoxycytidine 5'-triphosphate deaminase [Actinomycetes bacterium]
MFPGVRQRWLPGALSKKQMKQLIDEVYISGVTDFNKSADYSSIDLHISDEGYRMKHGSVKPFSGAYSTLLRDSNIAEKLDPDSDSCFKLEPTKCYVFKLKEVLNGNLANTNVYGQATAKSSIGRLDVIARLIVDSMSNYEYFDSKGYSATGQMFLEIIPISFGIRVKEGASLSQIRFFYGDSEESIIRDKKFIESVLHGSRNGEGYLTVELTNISLNSHEVTAFCARDLIPGDCYIDIWKKGKNETPCPSKFWRFIKLDNNRRLKLENGKFYILRSKERIALPPGVAVYARAMDETLGEMRIHYAGFAHPFFGLERADGQKGTPLIFEVRAHNVDVSLGNGERLAKLIFYRMSEAAEPEENGDRAEEKKEYANQELKLSKYFRDWPQDFNLDEDGNLKLPEETAS